MANETWFITGTSRGFGREWTIAALDRGNRVAATARDTGALDDLVSRYGDRILPLALDVQDRSACFAAVDQEMPEYAELREKVKAQRKTRTGKQGDPKASARALLKVVDAKEPPLRAFFGAAPLGIAKADYAKRLEGWENWQPGALEAQGD